MQAPVAIGIIFGCLVAACGGAKAATKNRTFYDWSIGDGSASQFERAYPSLNWPEKTSDPNFIGVSILGDGVRFSRPRNWLIRDASNRPEEPFIRYISPNAYSFAIYGRRDEPEDSWEEVLARYEEDAKSVGAKIVGRRVPMATAIGQGWAFTVERDVKASKQPLLGRCREVVIRAKELVVLVQVVHQERDLSAFDQELLRAVGTIHVR